MPYYVSVNSSKCPANKPVAVIKRDDGKVMGCHENKAAAGEQLKALYANEKK